MTFLFLQFFEKAKNNRYCYKKRENIADRLGNFNSKQP